MNPPNCVVCSRACIPLADYDQPTCIACDDTMRLILARAGMLEQPRRPRLVQIPRPGRVVRPCGTHAAFNRHKARGEPIDSACAAAERRFHADRYIAAQRRRNSECTVRVQDAAS